MYISTNLFINLINYPIYYFIM